MAKEKDQSRHDHSHHGHAHHDHDHDHAHPATPDEIVAGAEESCAARGLKLTDQRKDVMRVLAESSKPLGAYDILSLLTMKGYKKLAPVSVYRVLDFLLEAGLVHRLESRNAFILCPHQHTRNEAVVFLICEECGRVEEAMSDAVRSGLAEIARKHDFVLKGQVIELRGQCTACAHQPMVA
jgi:Fur family transcriptional regulator, zinc uptake regulator